MDQRQVERGREWLQELLHLAEFSATVSIEANPPFADESQWLRISETDLTPEKIELLLGQGGKALDAIQYLTNAILNLTQEADRPGAFTVELANYRQQRYGELKLIADQAAEETRLTGKEVELKSLSSAERRQIHTLLKQQTDLETNSRGQEPDRRLVVRCLNQPA
jgi:spoIIIJ-associated protein